MIPRRDNPAGVDDFVAEVKLARRATSMNQLSIEDTDNGALVSYGTNSILLVGVAANDLHNSDFII